MPGRRQGGETVHKSSYDNVMIATSVKGLEPTRWQEDGLDIALAVRDVANSPTGSEFVVDETGIRRSLPGCPTIHE